MNPEFTRFVDEKAEVSKKGSVSSLMQYFMLLTYQAAVFHLSGCLMDEEGTNCNTLLCLLGSFKGLARVLLFSSFQISHISDQCVN